MIFVASAGTGVSAASGPITEYRLPAGSSLPCEVEIAPDGQAWVQEVASGRLDRIDLATGRAEVYTLPVAATTAGIDIGPDGNLWLPELVGSQIVRVNTTTGAMTYYPMPWGTIPAAHVPVGVDVSDDLEFGTDGAAWFTINGLNAIGRMDIKTGVMTKYQLPTPAAGPLIIKQGPPGYMAFVESVANKIGTINMATGAIREYRIPTPASVPLGITTAADGTIWFAEAVGQKIAKLNAATASITEYSLPALSSLSLGNPLPFPGPLKFGTDGNLYIAEGGFFLGDRIGRFDPRTLTLKQYTTPSAVSGPCDLNNEIPGEILAPEFDADKLAVLRY